MNDDSLSIEEALEESIEEVKDLSWENTTFCRMKYTYHERIRAVLLLPPEEFNVVPVAEFRSKDRGRVDAGWLRDGNLRVAFEVDNTYRSKSIEKLTELPTHVTKVIISKSTDAERIWKKRKYIPEEIRHVDAMTYDSAGGDGSVYY